MDLEIKDKKVIMVGGSVGMGWVIVEWFVEVGVEFFIMVCCKECLVRVV